MTEDEKKRQTERELAQWALDRHLGERNPKSTR